MVHRIARHEWQVLAAERTALVLTLVLLACLAAGVVNGVRWRGSQAAAIADARREERDRVAAALATIRAAREKRATLPAFADPGNPDTAARQFAAHYAVRPPYPLMPLAIGQTDLLPAHVKVTSESRDVILAGSDTTNPLSLMTGHFDVAFVLVYLYPLFVLAISYNMLSGEREQGTLALLLSQPITLPQLLAGKVAMRAGAAAILAVTCLVFAAIVAGGAIGTVDVALRAAGVAAVVFTYGLFWVAAALMTGLRARSSAGNAVILAGMWLCLTVILPSAGHLLIDAFYPVPSRVEMIQAMREASDAANREGASLLGRFYQDHPELAPEGTSTTDFAAVKLAVDSRIEESVAPVVARFETQLARQQRVASVLRFLSPAILAHDALADLSGTGAARHRWFVAQVTQFHEGWRAFFSARIAGHQPLADYSQVPAFHFQEEPVGQPLRRAALGVGGVLLLTAIAFATARLAARRGGPLVSRAD